MNLQSWFILFCFLAFSVNKINPELRFCYKGPHRFSSKECPFGVYFNKPINSNCLYVTNTINTSNAPYYATDGCIQKVNIIEKQKIQPADIKKIFYNDDGGEIKDSLTVASDPTCINECFGDVEPGVFSPTGEELPEYSYQVSSTCSDEKAAEQIRISEKLFDYLLLGNSDVNMETSRIHELLEYATTVLMRFCGEPYVEEQFLIQVNKALRYLHTVIHTGPLQEIPVRHFNIIKSKLESCLLDQNSSTSFLITGTRCSNKAKIDRIHLKGKSDKETLKLRYKVEPKSYRFPKFDPFIEAAWAVFDFVHNYCFDYFRETVIYHDIFAGAIDSLFQIKAISERWYCPHKLKNEMFWSNLAGVSDLKLSIRNIDFCAQAAAKISVFGSRVERSFETIGDTPEAELRSAEKVGWKESSDEYWQAYDRAGGLASLLRTSDDGICVTTKEELKTYTTQYPVNC